MGDAFGTIPTAAFKGVVDPVTEVDHRSEAAIVQLLATERPGDAVLAEERGGSRDLTGRHWIVDPLDGTVNFLHGIPQVSVAVSLYEDGRPLIGVVIDPLREEEFIASTGGGTRLNGTEAMAPAVVSNNQPHQRN